jgi:cysteine-rich repeat protein
LAVCALALATPSTAAARPRRLENSCREVRNVVLHGLCRTYCDALQCDLRDDRRACEPLRRLYERVSRGSTLPCEEVEEPPVCGDGEVNQNGEQCDDGNNDSCDGCSFDCRLELCGDGVLCGAEQCEAGDVCDNGLDCNDDCTCPDDPPPPLTCGESAAPECGGSCPSGRVCVSRETFCECIGTSE